MKKILTTILISLLFFFISPCNVEAQDINLSAEAAVLIDGDTGAIMYGKNHLEQRPPASTTKVLTAILAIEQGDLAEVVSISKRSAQTGEASINLLEGETITLENLLYGALLKSGNDACVAIAEGISPTVEEFVGLMNLKAKLLGCTNTNFVNTNGLPHNNHYTSALDLAVITRYALNNPIFAQIVATPTKTIQWENSSRKKYIQNTNKLLTIYPGANGVKTGTTDKAGQCLIASATREGRTLIAVVLKSHNRYGDASKLLDYGFNNYYNLEVIKKNQVLNIDRSKFNLDKNLVLKAKENFVLTLEKGTETHLTCEIKLDSSIRKKNIPIGETIGYLKLYNYNQEIGTIALYAEKQEVLPKKDYSKQNIWDNIKDKLNF
ncbi:MAG: D-alanyl-D-alanine carboxypeptidase [Clostridia bacterium]|nr:D-alanyl-D-alanine carboxypeptidase [Clostridia bacterium]